MADWAQYERTVARRTLEALRAEVAALQSKARGHQDGHLGDVGNRRAYTRVLAIIDRRLGA